MTLQAQDKFFLTRQSANIMEELLRRLSQAGSISLVHGVKGSGKSRLLLQFCQHKLDTKDYKLVRFNANHSFQLVQEGAGEYTAVTFFTQVITQLNNNSTIVIDQFENMPVQLQQTLLKFWSNEAVTKGLRLVLSTQSGNLADLIELSKRFHLQIDCVALKPLKYDEQLDYLRANCCKELRHVAVIAAKYKKKLKLTNGLFPSLMAFKSEHSAEILCQETSLSNPTLFNKKLLYGISGLLVIFFITLMIQQNLTNTDPLQVQAPPVLISKPVNNGIKSITDDLIDQNDRSISENVSSQKVEPGRNKFVAIETIEPNPENLLPIVEDNEVIFLSETVVNTLVPDDRQGLAFFEQRLRATKLWLSTADLASASIQLMTISQENDPQESLNKYLKKLQTKQVDLEKIKIYPLIKGGRRMYGVLYGEFSSLNMAHQEIKSLPDVLKANKPFPRTVKGLNNEISER